MKLAIKLKFYNNGQRIPFDDNDSLIIFTTSYFKEPQIGYKHKNLIRTINGCDFFDKNIIIIKATPLIQSFKSKSTKTLIYYYFYKKYNYQNNDSSFKQYNSYKKNPINIIKYLFWIIKE